MFQLYALSIYIFAKIRQLINKIIIWQKRSWKHSIKNILFDIQSLADQIY